MYRGLVDFIFILVASPVEDAIEAETQVDRKSVRRMGC